MEGFARPTVQTCEPLYITPMRVHAGEGGREEYHKPASQPAIQATYQPSAPSNRVIGGSCIMCRPGEMADRFGETQFGASLHQMA